MRGVRSTWQARVCAGAGLAQAAVALWFFVACEGDRRAAEFSLARGYARAALLLPTTRERGRENLLHHDLFVPAARANEIGKQVKFCAALGRMRRAGPDWKIPADFPSWPENPRPWRRIALCQLP